MALSAFTESLLQRIGLTEGAAAIFLSANAGNADTVLAELDAVGIPRADLAWLIVVYAPGSIDDMLSVLQAYRISIDDIATGLGVSHDAIRSVLEEFGASPTMFDPPAVVEINDPYGGESDTATFTVTLDKSANFESRLALEATGTADLDDFDSYSFTHGVTLMYDGGLFLVVPPGVDEFDIVMPIAENAHWEPTETFSLSVGGVTGTATIEDDDEGLSFLPHQLEDMAPLLQLNAAAGLLSTTTLRNEVLAVADADDYSLLFDPSNYFGAGSGVFTNEEALWTLGDQPATEDTVESLYYGTLVQALRNISFGEKYAIDTFLFNNQEEMQAGDVQTWEEFYTLMTNAVIDPAASNERHFDDATIQDIVVDVTAGMVDVVEFNPSLFHALVNWVD